MSGTRFVLVCGTDTGVGKTFVAVALARSLAERGVDVRAVKPLESGCGAALGAGEDGVLLAAATGQARPSRALLRLRAPLAPPVAADAEGAVIDLDHLCARIRRETEGAEVVLVEAAGGLLSPLSWEETAVDLAHRLGASVLVVAANRLGTVSQSRLVLTQLSRDRLPVLGLVLSTPQDADGSIETNAATLRRTTGLTMLLELPRCVGPDGAGRHLEPLLGPVTGP